MLALFCNYSPTTFQLSKRPKTAYCNIKKIGAHTDKYNQTNLKPQPKPKNEIQNTTTRGYSAYKSTSTTTKESAIPYQKDPLTATTSATCKKLKRFKTS
jgi:hypothetical protein